MSSEITYKTDLAGVNWREMKATLKHDHFDNGRTPEQLRAPFENSYVTAIAYAGDAIIGTARALSDGVCNAYVVDVWTLSQYRNQGVARMMLELLEKKLEGQHVYLFTDDAVGLYEKCGYEKQDVGMGKVVGKWLKREA